jgi:peptidoglycan/xylan/chitin deacetylase (PgdA/CDA1 family)
MVLHMLAPIVPSAAGRLGLARTLPTADGVAITFDDGPHPEGTPAVLDVLDRAGARATFFVIGEQVERRPRLVAEILERGHAVALHGYRHRLQSRMSVRAVQDDVRRGQAAIVAATGRRAAYHRPPYGIYSASGLAAVRAEGLKPLLWSAWGKDWRKFTTPARIAARATARVKPGGVILLHDADFYSSDHSHQRTVRALGPILAELERRELATVLPV